MTGAQHIIKAFVRRGLNLLVTRPSIATAPLHIEAATLKVRVVNLCDAAGAVRVADGAARHLGRPVAVALDGMGDVEDALGPWKEIQSAHSPVLAMVICDGLPEEQDDDAVYTQGPDALANDLRRVFALVYAKPSQPVRWYLDASILASTETELRAGDHHLPPVSPDAQVEHVQLRRAAKLVDEAHRVLLWVGGDALHADAGTEVANLADRIGAPVITTVQAAGLLPALHPCLVNLPAHLPLVGQLWDDADLVIAIGAEFDRLQTQGGSLPEPQRLITIQQDHHPSAYAFKPTVLLRGDIKVLTNALTTAVTYRGGTSAVRNRNDDIRRSTMAQLEATNGQELALVQALSAAIPDHSQVIADWSLAGAWLADLHPWTLPRSLAMPYDTTQNRWAVPAWAGAAIMAAGTRDPIPVIGLTGEQGVIANLSVLAALSSVNQQDRPIPATLIVVDDGGYGRLRSHLAMRDLPAFPAEYPSPQIVNLARSLGLRADIVHDLDEVTSALNLHLATPDPTILVIQVRPALPPSDPDLWYRRQ